MPRLCNSLEKPQQARVAREIFRALCEAWTQDRRAKAGAEKRPMKSHHFDALRRGSELPGRRYRGQGHYELTALSEHAMNLDLPMVELDEAFH